MGRYEFNKMGTQEKPYNKYLYNEEDFKNFVKEYLEDSEIIKDYNNAIISFDTETTSTIVNGEKFAFVYIWQMAFGKEVWYGRDIHDIITIVNILNQTNKGKIIIWIHNIGFDWNFFKTYFEWDSYLFMSKHKPLYMITGNVEFRCTYLLTNKSLDTISKDDIDNKLYKKQTGDLDYNICRLPSTDLTEKEIDYCLFDVLTMNEFIIEYMKKNNYKSFKDFPYTKTGRIRRMFRNATVDNEDKAISAKYRKLMSKLKIEYEEYKLLQRAFQGGFTHANGNYVGDTYSNIYSVDIASSYPAVITTKKFPMSKGIKFQQLDDENLQYILDNKLCIFNIYMEGVKSKINFEHFWSEHKAYRCLRPVSDNGRLVECKSLITVMTNIDLKMFLKCYNVDEYMITDGYWYEPDYLPIEVVNLVLGLYSNKTKYKEVEGMETVYKSSKEDNNSVYGMMVTDICTPVIKYDSSRDVYTTISDDESMMKQIDDYNMSKKRFLFYPWGVFVTAYAREKLWNNILKLKDDYLYSDTDSNKFKFNEKNLGIIDETNASIIEEIKKVCKERNLSWEQFAPKDYKGIERPIGAWELDAVYTRFKTLGAKRYLTEENGNKLKLTCAGWNKKKGVEYLKQQDDPFDTFKIGLVIPPKYSGRTNSTYSSCDSIKKAVVKDYTGKEEEVCSESWIHIEPTATSLDASASYIRYLNSIKLLEQSMRLC